MNAPQPLVRWPDPGTSRIPFWAYTDPSLYQQELERLFYGPHWNYIGLAIEIPRTGDYKLSWVGERQVIMVRDRVAPRDRDTDHGIRVVENRCAHRGVRFCQPPMDGQTGNARSFVCPYHQWTYKLNGDLAGLPFKDGVKADGPDGECVHGGMPADFDLSKNGLTQLRVAVLHGLVFATFSEDAEPLEDYLGSSVMPWLNRIFQGRELRLLGTNRQRIPGNWKLMMENIKDPYHPGLLHTWFVTFGLWRADQKSRMVMDTHGRHAVMLSRRNDGGANRAVTEGVTSFKADMQLGDPRLLDVVPEPWWTIDDPSNPGTAITPTVTMITLFPGLIVQQQVNSLSTRHIVPRGPGEFDFVWTHFGFADDTEEMTTRRLRQANLFGPAGFVSADDGEVIEFSQDGFRQWGEGGSTLVELGGKTDDVGGPPTEHMVTETLIRSMYAYWRRAMGGLTMPLTTPETLALRQQIDAFNADYAAVLDDRRFAEWPELFLADARYRVQGRENFDRGLPLCLIHLESQAMMRDRVVGATTTIYHAPYYTRHVVGCARITHAGAGTPDDPVRAEASYAVFRTRPGSTSEVFQVGRYIDAFVHTPEGLRLQDRRCVYDSEMVLNSLIYPV